MKRPVSEINSLVIRVYDNNMIQHCCLGSIIIQHCFVSNEIATHRPDSFDITFKHLNKNEKAFVRDKLFTD